MSAGTLLSVRGLAKAFAVPVLDGIDLDVRAGEVHALVGENGAGKSTLARIVAGILPSDRGSLFVNGEPWRPATRTAAERAGVCLVLQELNVIPTWTVSENVWLGRPLPARWGVIDRTRLDRLSEAALARVGLAGVDPRRPIGELGTGQQQLVEIARGLSRDVRLLILDEPTASLAPREVELLVGEVRALTARGAAVIFISHRLDEVLSLADRVSVLRDGHLVATRLATETSAAELIALMVGREFEAGKPSRMPEPREHQAAHPVLLDRGEPLLRVEHLRTGTVVRDVSFAVRAGEIVGLAGLMGSGRTETLRGIVGAEPADAGEVHVQGRRSTLPFASPHDASAHGVGLLPEDRRRQGLVAGFAIRPNLTLTDLRRVSGPGGRIDAGREGQEAADLVARLDVRCRSVEQSVDELSGGNQQKVAFGRWLFKGCRILLCDEPTRGIDVAARAALHASLRQLAASGVAIVVASSDMSEVLALSDRVVVLSAGVVSRVLEHGDATEAAIAEAAFSGHRRAS